MSDQPNIDAGNMTSQQMIDNFVHGMPEPVKAEPVASELCAALQALLDVHHEGQAVPIPGGEGYVESVVQRGESALAAHPEQAEGAGAVAPGWKLVPIDPTAEMMKATGYGGRATFALSAARRDWSAMLAAAPHPPTDTSQEQEEPVAHGKWDGAEEWMPLAWDLCANECGEDACTELIWEGGPIKEPWGDRWLKYEDQAKEMIAMVRKHVPATLPTDTSAARPEPWVDNAIGQNKPRARAAQPASTPDAARPLGYKGRPLRYNATPDQRAAYVEIVRAAQPVEKVPDLSDEEIREIWARLLKIDAEGSLIKFARAIIARTSEGDKP